MHIEFKKNWIPITRKLGTGIPESIASCFKRKFQNQKIKIKNFKLKIPNEQFKILDALILSLDS